MSKILRHQSSKQGKAERLIDYYKIRDFKPIIAYCKTSQFFQDVPFSCPFTFIAIDIAFPEVKCNVLL
jgi:hypothetical protein